MLRIEDLDHPKVKRHATAQAIADLRWLGLDWDEGPDSGGPCAPYTQSHRLPWYRDALKQLQQAGLVYPCICSRRDVENLQSAPHAGEEGLHYAGTCRDRFAAYAQAAEALGEGRLPVWRYRTPIRETCFEDAVLGPQRQTVAPAVGDFPVARGPDGAGYTLAVVVDDAAMGITEVVRGDDLADATHRQLLLAEELGTPVPQYAHVPLVVAEDGRRLAKRHGDTRIASLRGLGVAPGRVVGLLAWWCGWADFGATVHPGELVRGFRWSTLDRHPAVLSREVRHWLGIEPVPDAAP